MLAPLLALCAACTPPAPGAPDGGPPPESTGDTAAVPSGSTGPTGSAGCGSSSIGPGSYDETLSSGGVDRRFLMEVPPGYDGVEPVPLVIDLHGTDETAAEQRLLSKLAPAADQDGFVVAWPDSQTVAGLHAWLLTCDGSDVDFATALLDHLEDALCVDRSRIVVTGISNGGYFTNVLGSVLGDRIAAIAPVSGGPGFVPALCPPRHPVTATIVHGTADPIVPFSEGEATRDLWSEADGCGAPETDSDGCAVSGPCDGGTRVRFCAADGVGHLLVYSRYPTTDRIRDLVAATGRR